MADIDPKASASAGYSDALRREMDALTGTQRAAVLMLLLGEEQAANIIRYLNPKEVQGLGVAMVQVLNSRKKPSTPCWMSLWPRSNAKPVWV